jgi:hypothetical protein
MHLDIWGQVLTCKLGYKDISVYSTLYLGAYFHWESFLKALSIIYILTSSVPTIWLAKKEDVVANYMIYLMSPEDLYYC